MLDPRLAWIRRRQVNVQLHREMRGQHQPGVLGQRGDLQEGRDAAHARGVGHQVVGGAVADQVPVFGGAGQHLAGGDRGIELRGQRGVALVVVGVQRLLDPDQVERLQRPAHALRGGAVPLLVGVDHQRHRVAQMFAHRADPFEVARAVRLADLQLDAADAAFHRGRGVDQQLIERRMQEAARGVVAAHRIALRAEQLGQRQARAARLQVPQRDVEGADRLRRHAAAPDRGAGPAQLVPQPRDIAGVFAEQRRRQLAGVGVLAGTAGALRIAEAHSLAAVRRRDFGEQDRDLGHRLLAARQHLGVADRGGQRQIATGQTDPGDAVGGGGHKLSFVRRQGIVVGSE